LAVKLLYTAFLCVLVPYYWATYTPWNFLYFCDVALLLTLVGLWMESPFLFSTQAVAILLPQALWVGDLSARLLAWVHVTGMTGCMFNADIPLSCEDSRRSTDGSRSSYCGWSPATGTIAGRSGRRWFSE